MAASAPPSNFVKNLHYCSTSEKTARAKSVLLGRRSEAAPLLDLGRQPEVRVRR
jgi:hypothetical protein